MDQLGRLRPPEPALPQQPTQATSSSGSCPAPAPTATAPIAGDVIASTQKVPRLRSRSYLLDRLEHHFQGVDDYDKYCDALTATKNDAPKPSTKTQHLQLKSIQTQFDKISNRPWPTQGIAKATEDLKASLLDELKSIRDR